MVKILENEVSYKLFHFTVDFESFCSHIPVLDAIEMMKKLVFRFQNVSMLLFGLCIHCILLLVAVALHLLKR